MAVNIHNLIAAICPDVFCEKNIDEQDKWVNLRDRVKEKLKEKGYTVDAYIAAAEIAKPKESNALDFEENGEGNSVYYKNPFDLIGINEPIEKHSLVYDSTAQNLEPIYFWILDNLNQEYKDMKAVDKLIDNFVSSPGSGHFSEMGQKATKMQEEAMKMLGAANQVVKSILNLIYDLKEFRIRLALYNQYKSKNEEEKLSALYSLKQLWMDTVDMKRGNTSIKALALGAQAHFVTLIDAFMKAGSLKELDSLDLNDRVKRLLQQRLGEFLNWIEESEKELRKRYEIEKIYLKSQVNTVHLYARWAKPYLNAARRLEQNANANSAALVTAFNTTIFELTLLGQSEYKPGDDVNKGDLPKEFNKVKLRKYQPLIVVELKFRSIPERAGQQGYGFRGRVEIAFTSYALNSEEVKLLKEVIAKDDFGEVFKFMMGSTDESLGQLKDDIDSFLNEEDGSASKEEISKSNDTNPFSALFSGLSSLFKPSGKKEEKSSEKSSDVKQIKGDDSYEEVVRSMAIVKARQECKKMYNLYKKAHDLPSF